MTTIANKTSLKARWQLPEFIRTDDQYQTFVAFIEAYYEWMEQNDIGSGKQGVVYGTQNLLNYSDVDFAETGENFNRFIDYYMNEFLPNFPKDTLADKAKLIKIARQLYQTKGTPASYKFLFRALYNSDVEVFPTRDLILRASDGKWYVPKSLRLDTNDEAFFNTKNLRLFGETSKSIATIERAITVGNRIEVYISDIQRLFQSGEDVRVVDNTNTTVYFKDGEIVPSTTVGSAPLKAKILGTISSVQINPNRRGQLYQGRSSTYSGDPVVFYGGLLEQEDAVGATAFVNEVTTGSLRAINVLQGGYGYREDPNTIISITGGGGTGAIANVASVDPDFEIVVDAVPKDIILYSVNKTIGELYTFFGANNTADLNCSLANAFTFTSFSTYPLTSVILNNGGGGYSSLPFVRAISQYETTQPTGAIKGDVASLGILGPIDIVKPGTGYANGEYLIFTGDYGIGANANVTVNATGSIVSVTYLPTFDENGVQLTPTGGFGYSSSNLPTITIDTVAGSGAEFRINGILGEGALFEAVPDERGIGAITSFVIENFGEDYISAPNVSLKVRDIVVKDVSVENLVKRGEAIYQGSSVNTAVFKAFVDSISLLEPGADQANSKYLLRTYNYSSNTKTNLPIVATDRAVGDNISMNVVTTYNTFDASGNPLFKDGIRTYGNGAAQATARFLNGLIIGEGQYLNDDGFPSSYQLLESEDYNNFTYELAVQKSFSAYEEILYGLLHPAGTKVRTVNRLKSQFMTDESIETFTSNNTTLSSYTGVASNATMYASFDNTSNNIVKLDALAGANIAEFIFAGSRLEITTDTGPNVYSAVVSVDESSNTVTLKDNVYLYYANVAYADVTSGVSKINITEITDAFDLINNGEYSNTQNKLLDIAFDLDNIRIYNNATEIYVGTIDYVSYSNNTIFLYPAISFTANNCLVSVGRDIVSTDVKIYNILGNPFYSEITTETGAVLTTEAGARITIG